MTEGSLAKMIEKFPTVQGEPCFHCGNPWFFDLLHRLQCTTCGHSEEKKVEAT